MTDERNIKPVSATAAERGALSTPWNTEAECGTREGGKVTMIKIGVPTARTPAEVAAAEARGCDTEAREEEEAEHEINAAEGCYKENPAPAGCVAISVVEPSFGLELTTSGTVRARAVSGVGNGLNQTRWQFEGAKSGELECTFPAACTVKFTLTGTVKDQGAEAAQLMTYK